MIIAIIERNINELCKMEGIDSKELAKRVGVNPKYFVVKRTDYPVSMIIKIAEEFGVQPQKLWDENFTQEVKLMGLVKQRDAIDEQIRELNEEWVPTPKNDPTPEEVEV